MTDFAVQGTVQVPASEIQLPSGFIVDDVERKNKESTFVDHLAFDESLERFWMDRQDRFQVVQHRQGAVHHPVHMAFANGPPAFLVGKDFDSTRNRLQVEIRVLREKQRPIRERVRKASWSGPPQNTVVVDFATSSNAKPRQEVVQSASGSFLEAASSDDSSVFGRCDSKAFSTQQEKKLRVQQL